MAEPRQGNPPVRGQLTGEGFDLGLLHIGEPARRPRSAHLWGFAIYLASRDGYEDSVLPDGLPIGTAQNALDCAGDLYLTDLNL